MKVLITGSNGFVGKELSDFFKLNGIDHKCLTRKPQCLDSDQKYVLLDDFYCVESWVEVLKDIDVVVHLIAKTHNNFDNTKNSLEEYRKAVTGIDLTKFSPPKVKPLDPLSIHY